MLIPIVDVGYESKQLYDNISKDLADGGELTHHFGHGGNYITTIELVKNEDGT
jgi:hypothetical protein